MTDVTFHSSNHEMMTFITKMLVLIKSFDIKELIFIFLHFLLRCLKVKRQMNKQN